jgi:hypothetical protein
MALSAWGLVGAQSGWLYAEERFLRRWSGSLTGLGSSLAQLLLLAQVIHGTPLLLAARCRYICTANCQIRASS